MNYDLSILINGCRELNIELNDMQQKQFTAYYELLVEWNRVMNLTAITDFEDVLLKHFVDSLTITKAIDMSQVKNMIDVGTGAGFPGLPIKISYPHIKVTLLDSVNKRLNFLNEVIQQLNLEQISTMHGRAEDFSRKQDHRECYDLCVSRAVSKISCLAEYCLPYVKISGTFISYKSGKISDELKEGKKAITTLGGELEDKVTFCLGDSDIERSLLIIKKQSKTPNKYPRKAGIPAKEPIV